MIAPQPKRLSKTVAENPCRRRTLIASVFPADDRGPHKAFLAVEDSEGKCEASLSRLPATRDINFSVTPGECVGIVGD
jgi:ABC-type glutathione transport system ATPase component